jgi:hypothetical protein
MQKYNLNERLEEWLRQQGYPLEMRVAQFFNQRGWFFHHSRRYKDPILEKEHEIDLIAFYDDPAKKSPFHAHFVIECKWTPQKPWILFTSTRQTVTFMGYLRSTPMTDTATNAIKPLTLEDILDFPLYSNVKEGYSIVQAFSERSAIDAAYSAVQTVINAADYFARWMSQKSEHSIIFIPTIILDGELFQCSLADDSNVSIEELESGFMIYKAANEIRSVYIVRETGLSAFFDTAEVTFQSLRSKLKRKKI